MSLESRKKLNICLIGADFPTDLVGGQGVYTYTLAKSLRQIGHQVTVITAKPSLELKNFAPEVIYTQYDVREKNLPRFSLLAQKAFKKHLGNRPVDILHGNDIHHLFLAVFKPKNVRAVVTTTHNSYLQRLLSYSDLRRAYYPALIAIEQLVYLMSPKIICVSPKTASFVARYLGAGPKIETILNGVDTSFFTPAKNTFLRDHFNLSTSDVIILFVGRLSKRKGVDLLIQSLNFLGSNYHLVLVGEGDQKLISEQLGHLKDPSRVHVLGKMAYLETPKLYQSATLLTLPSQSEGLSLVLLEALSCGLPLVLTHTAGADEILAPSQNGYYATANPADLAIQIQKAASSAVPMGQKSRLIALEKFSAQIMTRKVAQVYRLALGMT